MRSMKTWLLGSAAALATVGAAQAADLAAKKAVPVEFVRVCSAYGTGFFYIPGTDTCLRLSGRARFEGGYQTSYARTNGNGDTAGYRGLARINLDARTQTGYGTLRAFLRVEVASRTGGPYAGGTSGTQQRIGNAFAALGPDQFGRAQTYVNADKAFVQFAGLTAGRASSFFDFYAHDFEFTGATGGSDVASTNLFAYTATLGNGFSATLSVEDPTARRSAIYSPVAPSATVANGAISSFGVTNIQAPIITTVNDVAGSTTVDVIQRNRLPDFVGVLRYDAGWGSAQVSAASHELNVGNLALNTPLNAVAPARPSNQYGYAVQGGIKVNLPMIAAGDALYLQGAYGSGAQMYTGYCAYSGCYNQTAATIQGQKFSQFFNDATVNPFTGRLEKSESFTVAAAYLHYWAPEWRSAVFGSYGEMSYSANARNAQGLAYAQLGSPAGYGGNAVGAPGTRFFQLSQALRDTYQFTAGANIIWSPVKDLDIGVEGFYTQLGVKSGRVIDIDKDPTAYARVGAINAGGSVRTTSADSVQQIRLRVQRDF
ncbi:porin [Methylobacterium sp. NFXW15]|uniref:porin n=1 Tax=Methylobacterium sp. NFXW15 TaxID=2819512 RepID=UPI003CE8E6FB